MKLLSQGLFHLPDHTKKLMLAVLAIPSAYVAPAYSEFSAKVEAGIEHDSQLSVVELDTATDESDQALTLKLDLDYKTAINKELELSAGYSLSQSLHQDFDEFDIRTHLLSAGAAYTVDSKTTAGVNYYYADSSLDRSDFLTLNRINPYISHYLSKQVFLRGNYGYSDKAFDGNSGRDSEVNDLGGDVYYFLDKNRHYVTAGYRFRQEDSNSARFDFESHQLKLRWVKRVPLLQNIAQKDAKLKLGVTYEMRDYDDISSANGEKRDDDRLRFSADLELPIDDDNTVSIDYEYSSFDSNLASVDYTQHLLGIRYTYTFY